MASAICSSKERQHGLQLASHVPLPLQVSEQQSKELKTDLEGLEHRHVELKRRFKLLYSGYRTLRHVSTR